MSTVREAVAEYRRQCEEAGTKGTWAGLEAVLVEREDQIADMLRMMGAQLGAMPEFVAKAIHDVGLGTPPTEAEALFVNQQFAARLAWLQEQFRQQGGA